ncbi:hypothetical protein ACFQ1S_03820 [Kibdelosporangium lantanae]|uniref:Uncharacterized protein n=1 Tax=Kibdelosporangium lantanae TaxID=1497396 RepID=A0ABW3M722_9PSEU
MLLNRHSYYKVLVVLERVNGDTDVDPQVYAPIRNGRTRMTVARTGWPRLSLVMIAFLVLVIVAQLVVSAVEAATNSDNCRTLDSGGVPGVIRCERDRTEDLLNTVAATNGALGYAELGAANARTDVMTVRIGGQKADLDAAVHGAYPFWETEFAYTYQEPKADSLAASYLRYLTDQVGEDIVRSHGDRPCAELPNPVLCQP